MPFVGTRSARLVKALAERYNVLPSEVLRRTPAELMLDLVLTYPPDAEATTPRPRAPDAPSVSTLVEQLKAGSNGR